MEGNKMKRYYIAYGSNLSLSQMERRCPTATVVGTSILKNWRLLFNGPASIERKEGYQVPVLIWELQPEDERSLDRYEGYTNYYRKEMLKVKVKDQVIDAMVYIMNDGGEAIPSRYYYDVLDEGYRKFKFNRNILRKAAREAYDYEGESRKWI